MKLRSVLSVAGMALSSFAIAACGGSQAEPETPTEGSCGGKAEGSCGGKADEEALGECEEQLQELGRRLEDLTIRSLLAGRYDRANAYLSVQAGAGGTESCDWAAMLMRMYGRWAERNRFKVSTIDVQPGEEAGIRKATALVASLPPATRATST